MRRWMFMAALSATLLRAPLWGQRVGNGGMAMGGAPGRYVAHGGFVGVPHGAYGSGGFHGPHGPGFAVHPSHPIHYPYYGWRYPWWGYRGYYGASVVWSDAPYSYPAETGPGYPDPPPDNSSANIAYEQQEEIDRLNDEVARLRTESGPADRAQQSLAAQIPAAAVLVFRDRHSEEIQNYAIAGNTLWVFTQARVRKIPIAELDVPATAKANADRGIDFRLPGQ